MVKNGWFACTKEGVANIYISLKEAKKGIEFTKSSVYRLPSHKSRSLSLNSSHNNNTATLFSHLPPPPFHCNPSAPLPFQPSSTPPNTLMLHPLPQYALFLEPILHFRHHHRIPTDDIQDKDDTNVDSNDSDSVPSLPSSIEVLVEDLAEDQGENDGRDEGRKLL